MHTANWSNCTYFSFSVDNSLWSVHQRILYLRCTDSHFFSILWIPKPASSHDWIMPASQLSIHLWICCSKNRARHTNGLLDPTVSSPAWLPAAPPPPGEGRHDLLFCCGLQVPLAGPGLLRCHLLATTMSASCRPTRSSPPPHVLPLANTVGLFGVGCKLHALANTTKSPNW
jgi:hypothetical protein